jgi:hypothetical protein
MGRYSANPSRQHHIRRNGRDDYTLSWVCDRYYAGSRLRFPTRTRRFTDEAGARRFAKRWGCLMPEPS